MTRREPWRACDRLWMSLQLLLFFFIRPVRLPHARRHPLGVPLPVPPDTVPAAWRLEWVCATNRRASAASRCCYRRIDGRCCTPREHIRDSVDVPLPYAAQILLLHRAHLRTELCLGCPDSSWPLHLHLANVGWLCIQWLMWREMEQFLFHHSFCILFLFLSSSSCLHLRWSIRGTSVPANVWNANNVICLASSLWCSGISTAIQGEMNSAA